MSPVYSQIDPMRLAEVERAIRISGDYAERIAVNLKGDALPRLLAGYPSHGFVIDRREARDIFEKVPDLSGNLAVLMAGLRSFSQRYMEYRYGPFFAYLSDEPVEPTPPNAPNGGNDVQQGQDNGAGDANPGGADAQVRGPDRAGGAPNEGGTAAAEAVATKPARSKRAAP